MLYRMLPAELAEVVLHGLAARCRHTQLHLLVDLTRRFTTEQLIDAAAEAVETFPVLGCRYRIGGWRDRWIRWTGDVGDLVEVVEAVEDVEAETLRQVHRVFDHERIPSFRIAVLQYSGGSRLVISAHHSVADGGGIKALANVIAAHLYRVPPVPPPTAERALSLPVRSLRATDLPVLVAELIRESLRPLSILRVRRLRRRFGDDAGEGGLRWRPVFLDGEETEAFARFCRSHGATLNDGLVAALARLGATMGDRGPVATGYTIDLRRYLPRPGALVTNLHAVSLVVLPRRRLLAAKDALTAVSDAIGEQKRRLIGMSYVVLPMLAIGWLPHALLRIAGRVMIGNLLSYVNRAPAVTNIGSLDEALAPFGEDAIAASILGPFVDDLTLPVVVATGFRGTLTLHVCGSNGLALEGVTEYAAELRDALLQGTSAVATAAVGTTP